MLKPNTRVLMVLTAGLLIASCTSSSDSDDAGPAPSETISLELPTPATGPADGASPQAEAIDEPEASASSADSPSPTTTTGTSSPSPSQTPSRTLAVTSPDEGANVSDPVVVEVDVSGFTLTELTGHMDDDKGHLHAFIDEAPPPDRIRMPTSQSIVTSDDSSIELGNLEPGEHTVTVVATHAYPVPFEPRVEATVTFTVSE